MMNQEGNLVKVGQTKKLKERRQAYKTHNPTAIMRSTCAGGRLDEAACEMLLIGHHNAQQVNGTEWYKVSQEVFDSLYQLGLGFFKGYRNIGEIVHFKENF